MVADLNQFNAVSLDRVPAAIGEKWTYYQTKGAKGLACESPTGVSHDTELFPKYSVAYPH